MHKIYLALALMVARASIAAEPGPSLCSEGAAQPQQVLDACTTALAAPHVTPQQTHDFLLARSWAYEFTGRLDQAIADVNRIIASDPNSYQVLNARAGLYVHTGDWNQVVKDADAAFALAPEAVDRYITRGVRYAEALKLSQAIDVYSEGIKRYPQDSTLYLDRASAYHTLGKYDLAMSDLEVAARLDPSDASVHESRAGIYVSQGKPALAIDEYNAAIRQTGESSSLLAERCHAELVTDEVTQAIADCTKAIEQEPSLGIEALPDRGFAYLKSGKPDLAIKDFDAALKQAPGIWDARYGLALVRFQSGAADGRSALDAVIKNDPDGPGDMQEEFGISPPEFWHKPVPVACTTADAASAKSPSY